VTLFLCQPELGSNAVVEMPTLLLPEIFQVFILDLTESKLLATNQFILQFNQIAVLLFIQPET
jgi:hypothetical protein